MVYSTWQQSKGKNICQIGKKGENFVKMAGVRVGFIGAGQMATALARGIVSQGKVLQNNSNLYASDLNPQSLKSIKDLGGQTTNDNLHVVDNSDVVILAVKPQIMSKVLEQIKPAVAADPKKLLVSIAAGVKIQTIQQSLLSESKVSKLWNLTNAQNASILEICTS